MNSKSIKFNVALINTCTEAEGPYKRMAIWFQGCNIKCKDCCNPELIEIKPAHIMNLEDILKIASKSRIDNDIEGITFLGGEPTLQNNLYILSKSLREIGLGVILFTGKNINELSKNMINNVDLIVDGPFISKKIDNARNMIGSKNQNIHCITSRYENDLTWFSKLRKYKSEINISKEIVITGDKLL